MKFVSAFAGAAIAIAAAATGSPAQAAVSISGAGASDSAYAGLGGYSCFVTNNNFCNVSSANAASQMSIASAPSAQSASRTQLPRRTFSSYSSAAVSGTHSGALDFRMRNAFIAAVSGMDLLTDIFMDASFDVHAAKAGLVAQGGAGANAPVGSVPSPGAITLLLTGLAGLGFASRRKSVR